MSTEDRKALNYLHVPNGGRVIATLEGVHYNASYILEKLVENNSKYLSAKYVTPEQELKKIYKSVAKVNSADGDVYDSVKGEEVAYEKVMKKYHTAMDKRLASILADVRGLAAAVEHYMTRHNISYDDVATVEEIKKSRFGSWSGYQDK
jgi:tRNA U34 5-carboxymethylaminomethyl modifying enzyme MnmG/GidA